MQFMHQNDLCIPDITLVKHLKIKKLSQYTY